MPDCGRGFYLFFCFPKISWHFVYSALNIWFWRNCYLDTELWGADLGLGPQEFKGDCYFKLKRKGDKVPLKQKRSSNGYIP